MSDPKIIVALLAALTGLLVAAISSVSAIVASRASKRLSSELEVLKHSLSRRAEAQSFVDDELRSTLEALRAALRAIQQVKDAVQVVLFAVPGSLDNESASAGVLDARENLFRTYEENHAHLSDAEDKACHQTKNIALTIENQLAATFRNIHDPAQLSQQTNHYILWMT